MAAQASCQCLGPGGGTAAGEALGMGMGSRPLPPPVLGDRSITLELEQGQKSLCVDAGQINLRF